MFIMKKLGPKKIADFSAAAACDFENSLMACASLVSLYITQRRGAKHNSVLDVTLANQ